MLFIGKETNKEEIKDEKKVVDSIRCLGLDMINEANSGHSGIVLGAAPILYSLYAKHLKINPQDPDWYNRDRFIMSAGHGSALLYSTLYMAGYNITLDDLKQFRKTNSLLPGHPEYKKTPGVDMTTGPLGQGFASAVGIALGEEYIRNYFNKKGSNLINYYTYVLCGDGDLMEGISYEAASFAGSLKLSHLIVIYDNNNISLDGETNRTFNENIEERFKSMNWNTITVTDADDIQSLDNAINKAKESDKPTIIITNTVIGKYSDYKGTNKAHGAILTPEEINDIKEQLNIKNVPFAVSQEANDLMHELVNQKLDEYNKSKLEEENLSPELKNDLAILLKSKNPNELDIEYELPEDGVEEIRLTNGKILSQYAKNNPFILSGSADLNSSCKNYIENEEEFSVNNRLGRNIPFGVREHAMGAILNGLALSGLKVFGSTFLAFSDYLKPAIRMSAMMNLPVTYIFTNDSITIGEDGPTHQPVEQLISLRSIPNIEVFRPSDTNEIIGLYEYLNNKNDGPTVISIGKNKIKVNDYTSIKEIDKGAYIVKHENKKLDGIIISTGEELGVAYEIAKNLEQKEINLRIVSMPSIELFNKQPVEYKKEILKENIKIFVIEPSSSYSWYQFVDNKENLFTLDTFGISGNKDELLKEFKLDINSITNKIEEILK